MIWHISFFRPQMLYYWTFHVIVLLSIFRTPALFRLARKIQDYPSSMHEICLYVWKIMSGIFKNLGRKSLEKPDISSTRFLQTPCDAQKVSG